MSMYKIHITFVVSDLANKNEAIETGIDIAEHVTETFNDTSSIDSAFHVTVEKVQP